MAKRKKSFLELNQDEISVFTLGRSGTLAMGNSIDMALISVQTVAVRLGIAGVVANLFGSLVIKWL